MEAKKDDCEKCHGTRQVVGKDRTISICLECLKAGRLDQHDKNIKDASDFGIKL